MGWPRLKATCDFHAPLQFEDEIEVELLIAEIRSKTIRYRCYVWKDPDGPRIKAATGEMVAIHVRADRAAGTMEGVPIPTEVREKIEPAASLGE
jgi:acyl-CoA thioester hydrolase